jgi:hypothetical protein
MGESGRKTRLETTRGKIHSKSRDDEAAVDTCS